jgi:hypothetical protein
VEESSSLVQGAAFDSEGSRLITTTEERMNLWDLKTGARPQSVHRQHLNDRAYHRRVIYAPT